MQKALRCSPHQKILSSINFIRKHTSPIFGWNFDIFLQPLYLRSLGSPKVAPRFWWRSLRVSYNPLQNFLFKILSRNHRDFHMLMQFTIQKQKGFPHGMTFYTEFHRPRKLKDPQNVVGVGRGLHPPLGGSPRGYPRGLIMPKRSSGLGESIYQTPKAYSNDRNINKTS